MSTLISSQPFTSWPAWLQYCCIALIVGSIHFHFLLSPLPLTHDSHHHLARMANFALSIKEGQIPPRWAGNLNNGFGYPVFNFNYPLANIISLPLHLVSLTYESMYKYITFAAVLFLAWGMLSLTRNFTSNSLYSLFSTLLYCCNPYVTNLIYTRGTIGELLGMALLPWLLLLVWQQRPSWQKTVLLGIVTAAFLLAHNIFVLISSPVLILAIVIQLSRKPLFSNRNISLLLSLLLGFGMSVFFWLPALFEKQHTILDQVPLSSEYLNHFLRLGQLVFGPVTFGFSTLGPVDSLNLSPGLIQMIILGIAVIYLLKALVYRHLSLNSNSKLIIGLIIIALGYLLLQLPISLSIWKHFSLLHYLQFPWRLSSVVIFCLSLSAVWLFSAIRPSSWLLVSLSILLVLLTYRTSHNPDTFSYSNDYWLTYPLTTSLADENMPLLFNKNYNYSLVESIFANASVYASPAATISIQSWNGTTHRYSVKNDQPTTIVERTAYFPGWQVKSSDLNQLVFQDNPTFPGLITFKLEPGSHQIQTKFTQRTMPRIIGNSMSLLSLIALVFFALFKRKQSA